MSHRRSAAHAPTKHAGTPDDVPQKGTRLDIKSVPCPACKAETGAGCISTATGEPITGTHRPRRTMAVRAQNETVDSKGVLYYMRTDAARRVYLRERLGLSSLALARFFNYDSGVFYRIERGGVGSPARDTRLAAYGAWLAIYDDVRLPTGYVPREDD